VSANFVKSSTNDRAGVMAYIFYDTETTRIRTSFDQILQFAAIKKDDVLNVVETFYICGRLLPYIVPAPSALRMAPSRRSAACRSIRSPDSRPSRSTTAATLGAPVQKRRLVVETSTHFH
jgi:hypothetical protein